jgi:hypothetical protein
VNGGASTDLGLKILRVQGKGGGEPTLEVGQAGRLGTTSPGPSRPGSVAPSLPWVLMCLCTLPLHLYYFGDAILASKMEVLFAWRSVFYASLPGDVPSWHFGPCHHWKWLHQAHEHEQDSLIAPLNLLWIRPLCPCFLT